MYYATIEKEPLHGHTLYCIRQDRFKHLWVEQGIDHPHDVMIIANNLEKLRASAALHLDHPVDWTLTTS